MLFNDSIQWSFEIHEDIQKNQLLELGIQFNNTFLTENNITDIGVYFKDPKNDVVFKSPLTKIPWSRFVENFETVFTLTTTVVEKMEEIDEDNCAHYHKK